MARNRRSTFWERLNSLRKPKETITAFADRLGIGRTTLRWWSAGGVPNTASIMELSRATGISPLWLLTGEGPRELSELQELLLAFDRGECTRMSTTEEEPNNGKTERTAATR